VPANPTVRRRRRSGFPQTQRIFKFVVGFFQTRLRCSTEGSTVEPCYDILELSLLIIIGNPDYRVFFFWGGGKEWRSVIYTMLEVYFKSSLQK
jgi:hypothetical protein